MTYTAAQGDSWDSIAYRVWGDEFLFVQLMEANRTNADTIIFDGGEVLTVPEQVVMENRIVASPFAPTTVVSVISAPW